MPHRPIEREFGVPIAGEILDPARRTQTALKRVPPGHLDWGTLFGRRAPLVLDLGCGNGRFLIGSAVWRPDHDHLGVDVLPLVIRYATRRGNQRGLTNVRFAVAEAREFIERHVAPASVAEIHCYHPQPYDEPAQVHRRLFTPRFLALVHRALDPGGTLFVQTDHPGYWGYMKTVLPTFFDFQERDRPWPDAPKGRTRREIIALRRKLSVFRGSGTPKRSLSEAEVLAQADCLPPPVFNPDRRQREMDEIERGCRER